MIKSFIQNITQASRDKTYKNSLLHSLRVLCHIQIIDNAHIICSKALTDLIFVKFSILQHLTRTRASIHITRHLISFHFGASKYYVYLFFYCHALIFSIFPQFSITKQAYHSITFKNTVSTYGVKNLPSRLHVNPS